VCCFHFQSATVTHPDGSKIGTIVQSFSLKDYLFNINDAKGKEIIHITGNIENGLNEMLKFLPQLQKTDALNIHNKCVF